MAGVLMLQQTTQVGPVPLWWFWLLIAVLLLGGIVYLVGRIGPGGPWMR
jgi:hypothetical protein